MEHQLNLQSATSGCISRNGHLCIGLCIIVILYYSPLNYHHLLSLALISIFNVLIFIASNQFSGSFPLYMRQAGVHSCHRKKENNSDNNFHMEVILKPSSRCSSRTKSTGSNGSVSSTL